MVIFWQCQDISIPHDITLPRSWFLPLSKFLQTADSRGRNKNLYITLADSIIALLQRVKTRLPGLGALEKNQMRSRITNYHLDHLHFQNCDLSAVDEVIKGIFVFRM